MARMPAIASLALLIGCAEPFRVGPTSWPVEEICDGRDNDLDGQVDNPFRDATGAYLHDLHCGACERPCLPTGAVLASRCALAADGPRCVASDCAPEYGLDPTGRCVPRGRFLCRPCAGTEECGGFDGATCGVIASEARCTVTCDAATPCPNGFVCGLAGTCQPPLGDCRCQPGVTFEVACEIPLGGGESCWGVAHCEDGSMTPCAGTDELCDGVDNDCNGVIDDPFVNVHGAYGVDIHHCGGCGVDCASDPLPETDLTCGGPTTHPRCVMVCADAQDGVDVGDRVDADLLVSNGCECRVTALDDEPGLDPGATEVDANCDGADGVVGESFYVAPHGDDTWLGSPFSPLRTIAVALDAAAASLESDTPRRHVYVAAGSYPEVLTVREGVHVHAGYRPDFRARNPFAFVTEVYAPAYDAAPGGAALVATEIAHARIDGFHFRGAAAPLSGLAAYGALIQDCRAGLVVRDSVVLAGAGADGVDGENGNPGETGPGAASNGEEARPAEEDLTHACLGGAVNTVAGGAGQRHSCGSIPVAGGDGGAARCAGAAAPWSTQSDGAPGRGTLLAPGGAGGAGGADAAGPVDAVDDCPWEDCCSWVYVGTGAPARDGEPGTPGADGDGGRGCVDSIGQLDDSIAWEPDLAGNGSSGYPGAGGGGGGAGGSVRFDWLEGICEYADALGSGGGGGGAGGCGGGGGTAGTSGSASVGILLIDNRSAPMGTPPPTLVDLIVRTSAAGHGGRGGAGGPGGAGGLGGHGGAVQPNAVRPDEDSYPGADGGIGGTGGSGGGGGGGCGGSSIGIWARALPGVIDVASLSAANSFQLGPPGDPGEGGGGSTVGGSGAVGEVHDVLAR